MVDGGKIDGGKEKEILEELISYRRKLAKVFGVRGAQKPISESLDDLTKVEQQMKQFFDRFHTDLILDDDFELIAAISGRLLLERLHETDRGQFSKDDVVNMVAETNGRAIDITRIACQRVPATSVQVLSRIESSLCEHPPSR